jgi:alcohol dehydrogenase
VNTGAAPPGSSVAIVGLGGVGLCGLLGAHVSGARQIIAVDLSDEKLQLAAELGATHTFNARADDVVDAIRDVSAGGVEFAFEMAGSVPALELAYNVTRRGGTTVSTGLPHPERRLEIPAASLVAEERTLKGSYIGTCVPSRDLPRYMSLHEQGRLPVDRLLSGNLKLDDINAGFDALADGIAVRQVITLG